MSWIKFSARKPKLGFRVITRSRGHDGIGNAIEGFSEYKPEILSYKPAYTHWWDGELDFDLAVKTWYKEEKTDVQED